MNPLDLLMAPVLFFTFWGGFRIFKRTALSQNKKPNISKSSDVGTLSKVDEKVVGFQTPWSTTCPMCKRDLELLTHKFCACSKQTFGHFHIVCQDRRGYGCGYKWTMKGAQ